MKAFSLAQGNFRICNIEKDNEVNTALNVFIVGDDEDFVLQVNKNCGLAIYHFNVKEYKYSKNGNVIDEAWKRLSDVFNENDIDYIQDSLMDIFDSYYKNDYTLDDARQYLRDMETEKVLDGYLYYLNTECGLSWFRLRNTFDKNDTNVYYTIIDYKNEDKYDGNIYSITKLFTDVIMEDECYLNKIINEKLIKENK